jgi:hypothetical protein
MAFFWIQQWVALPVVYEGPMGDLPPGSRPQASDSAAPGFVRDGNPSLPASTLSPYKSPDDSTPFYSQLSGIPENQLRPDYRSPTYATTQYPTGEHGASPLNMASMAGTLPDYGSMDVASATQQGSQSVPRSLSGASASTVMYQLGQNLQMPGQALSSMSGRHQYGTAYATGPYQQQAFVQSSQHAPYPPFAASQSRMPANALQMGFQNYPGASQYMYYSAPYGHQGQYNPGHPAQSSQNHAMYERGGSMAGVPVGMNNPQGTDYQHHNSNFTGAHLSTGGLQGEQAAIGPAFGSAFPRVQGKRTISCFE